MGVVIAAQVIYLIENPSLSRANTSYRVVWIVLLSSVGVAIKYNFGLLGAGMCLIAMYIWNQRFGSWRLSPVIGRVSITAVVAGLVLLPMFARTIIMTGYPAYPSTIGAVPVAWRIDEDYAHLETEFIRSFARDPRRYMGQLPPEWNWFNNWIEQRFQPRYMRDHIYFSIPAFASAGGFLLLGITLLFVRKQINGLRWWFFVPIVASLVFWFIAAPAPRFAGASLWLLAIGAVTLLLAKIGWGQRRWHIYLMIAAMIAAAPVPFFVSKSIVPWIDPGPDNGLYRLPKPLLDPYVTDSGLFVWTSAKNNQCWDAPLPCTPYPHPNLQLREPDDISQGFLLPIGPDDPPQIIN